MSKQEDLYTGILARLVIMSLIHVTGLRFSPGDRASSLGFMAFMERKNQTRKICSLSK